MRSLISGEMWWQVGRRGEEEGIECHLYAVY